MGIFSDFGAPGRRRSGRRRRANARCGWPDVEPGLSPPCPRGEAAGAGLVDFQLDTSGHPPGALARAAAASHARLRDDGTPLPGMFPHGVAASVN